MKVDVIATAAEVTAERIAGKVAVVIDVFRATSVMVTALENGAERIIPKTGVEESFALKEKLMAANAQAKVILGGERHTVIIEGFDLDNSPLAYTAQAVAGSTIIMSTTNGTRAVNSAHGADQIWIASLLNATAATDAAALSGKDIVLICSGRNNRFTIEDALCAGKIVGLLEQNYGYTTTDLAWVTKDLYQRYKGNLREALAHCQHYNRIASGALASDVDHCLREDIYTSTPRVVNNGEIIQ